MTSKSRVQLAAYAEDRPRAALLACLALLALGAGATAGVLFAPHARESAVAAVQQADSPSLDAPSAPATATTGIDGAVEAVANRAADATVVAAVEHGADAGAAASAAVEATPSPDAGMHTVPTPSSPGPGPGPALTTLAPGRVAYLRCDGLSTRGGRYPCPRDRAFERAVWQALRGLQRCASLTPGRLELRFEIVRAQRLSFELRAHDRERARSARACLSTPLGSVHSTLAPERMVVSFAFELRGPTP